MKNRLGFTLVEVLITIGIIGIVAAMTIPNLLNKTNDTELKTAFKKSYSSLSQALEMVILDNGGTPVDDCYNTGSTWNSGAICTNFWTAFKSKLQVIKEYSGAVDGENIPDYTGTDLIAAQGGYVGNSGCVGGKVSIKTAKGAWTLVDGSMIISYEHNFADKFPFLILDTNGIKKPNKWGYDLFIFDLTRKDANSPVLLTQTYCGPAYEKGGYTMYDMLSK